MAGCLRVSEWSSTFRPLETEHFARTFQPRPGASVSSCYTSQSAVCTICPSVISVPAWCAGLCKSSYLHSLAGWVLTHVAASRGCDSDDLYSFVTGWYLLISIPSILTFTSLVQLVGCPVDLSNPISEDVDVDLDILICAWLDVFMDFLLAVIGSRNKCKMRHLTENINIRVQSFNFSNYLEILISTLGGGEG